MDMNMGGSMADLLNLAKNGEGNNGNQMWWIVLLLLYNRDGGLGGLRAGENVCGYTVSESDVNNINRKLDNNGMGVANAKCDIEKLVANESQTILQTISNNALLDAQTKADLLGAIKDCCCNSQLEGLRNTADVKASISALSTKNDAQFNTLENLIITQNKDNRIQMLEDRLFQQSQACQTQQIVSALTPRAPQACVPVVPASAYPVGSFGGLGGAFGSRNMSAGIGNTSSSNYTVDIDSGAPAGGVAVEPTAV